ncbi:hypothetical protein IEQ34_003487 [Dendrobium chrysotoxum]|uniref:Uncharacterized protein n=1 Tax=Dendrobium chrysotoxum TaxID=161865 RepID=A0AAV7HL70_DENCH|nr:hypothetical protein IEQ34_003487 [Dendrobium chrysotoxum]
MAELKVEEAKEADEEPLPVETYRVILMTPVAAISMEKRNILRIIYDGKKENFEWTKSDVSYVYDGPPENSVSKVAPVPDDLLGQNDPKGSTKKVKLPKGPGVLYPVKSDLLGSCVLSLRNIFLLSIVGNGGMGETTLLQHVYEDEIIGEFDP